MVEHTVSEIAKVCLLYYVYLITSDVLLCRLRVPPLNYKQVGKMKLAIPSFSTTPMPSVVVDVAIWVRMTLSAK